MRSLHSDVLPLSKWTRVRKPYPESHARDSSFRLKIKGPNLKKVINLAIQKQELEGTPRYQAYLAYQLPIAQNFEKAGKFEEAAIIYEELKLWEKAGEVRKIAKKGNAPIQTHYSANTIDFSTKAEIKDSVIHKSPIGASNEMPSFSICPYCGKKLSLPETPNFCPYCEKRLR